MEALRQARLSLTRDRARATFSAAVMRGLPSSIGTVNEAAIDTRDIDANLDWVAADFHDLVESASRAELGAPSNGTKWTNEQLLFPMLFGFVLGRVLLVLVKGFGRPPVAPRCLGILDEPDGILDVDRGVGRKRELRSSRASRAAAGRGRRAARTNLAGAHHDP